MLHTKETAAAQHFKGASAIPHRQTTFQRSMLCCAALCYRQTRAVMKKRRPWLLIKKHYCFLHRLHCYGKNYTGKTPLPHLQLKDAVLHDWNCQIKHTVGGVSKQVFTHKKNDKTFLMEMIDRLFTEKAQFCGCLEMSGLFVRAADL